MKKQTPPSAEEMSRLANSMSWEEQVRFLREHALSLTVGPSEKERQWVVAVVSADGETLSSVQSGRREAAIDAAVAMAAARRTE